VAGIYPLRNRSRHLHLRSPQISESRARNAGCNAVTIAYDQGAKVVAVSDSGGGIRSLAGSNPYEVFEHKEKTGSVMGFKKAKEEVANEERLAVDCNILVLAAM
jgi:glutamate dehydrogenase (NAD(P)+)